MTCDLAVLGGGVLGLSCAFEEALRGKRVVIIDPNSVGRKASWAAAGILARRGGLMGGSPLREFYLRSLFGYSDWLARVESESGVAVPYERCGDYLIFPTDDPDSIRGLEQREKQLRLDKAIRFSASDALPPFLRPHSSLEKVRVFHFPDEARVQNRILLEALETALRKRGAIFVPGKPSSWTVTGNESILAGEGWDLRAKQVLIAAGAWSREPLNLLGFSVPLRPVKGQLAMLPNFHGQDCMLHGGEGLYLIPRGDQLIAGATTEPGVGEEGFDAFGDASLRGKLRAFFPKVETHWTETWSGLRPRARDRLPLMGWVAERAGIALCTGHYKSGVSLAPLSARSMSALLNGEKPPVKLKPFDPWRKGGLAALPG